MTSIQEQKNTDGGEVSLEETEQTEQTQPIGEEWIERALAIVRVREYVAAEVFGEERMEQRRTVDKKKKFIEIYRETIGTITLACDQAGIGRTQFYEWMKTDPQFRMAVDKANDNRVDMVEDRLLKLIMEGDGPSIRFFLQAKDPGYKNKAQVEIVKGDRTFEDILYEQAEKKREIESGKKEKDGKQIQ